jgi:hypothetical protein
MPTPPMLYTMDQIALTVSWSMPRLVQRTYFVGRTTRRKTRNDLEAFNIAAPSEKPDWRVGEDEFARWLRVHGYRPVRKKL